MWTGGAHGSGQAPPPLCQPTARADRSRHRSCQTRETALGRLASYPFHDKTVVVTNCGRLCLYRKKINLSTCLAGQAVGVKEVDDGIWLVRFMDYDLGYVDLEEKTLQPLPNPFGPKLLPMCPVRTGWGRSGSSTHMGRSGRARRRMGRRSSRGI